MLYEPQPVPQLPDLMLLDEEEPCLSWPRLASFAPAAAASAPVPIAAHRDAARCTLPTAASLGSDLVDSMESTQTLLGASLRQEAAASAEPPAMRFVPVEATPAPYPQPYPQPQPLPQLHRSQPSSDWLFGGYGVIAEPQAHPHERSAATHGGWAGQEGSGHDMQFDDGAPCYARQPQPAHAYESHGYGSGWELAPASLPARAASCYGAAPHVAGTSTLSMSLPYSTQLGRHSAAPGHHGFGGGRRHVHLSNEALQFGNYRGTYQPSHPAYEPAASPEPDGMYSEGSDEDTFGQHPHFSHHGAHRSPGHGSPVSLPLDRSASIGRRSSHFGGPRSLPAAASSPRTINLKVKSTRARPAAAMAAARAAGEEARMPARHAARRSMALSTAALAEEAAFSSDSEGEPAGAAVERRSGHGGSHGTSGAAAAAAAASSAAAAANGKKKHNPWSLAETEALVDGVRLLGPSKWAEIKKLQVGGISELLAQRSAVDLKDKWRNLTRVAKLPKSVLKARAHKSTSDIPLDLLLAVKDLMEVSRD